MKIGVVGLGLIGGSLAIDLRQQGHTLVGVSRREQTCQQAVERGVVDAASSELKCLAEMDVVFLCPPIGAIAPLAEQLIPHLSQDTVLTDVGSVKQPIVASVGSLWPNFVGGHPMAGTEAQGLDAAQPNLFVDRPYVLTPTEATPEMAVERVSALVRSLRAQLHICDPADHDQAVAWISHLPVMVSASLIRSCTLSPQPDLTELAQAFASSGFRDTSRVGGGNPELGVMMARYNQKALLTSLNAYRQALDHCIQSIEQSDWDAIASFLEATQTDRPLFL
ncbi:prephenate/arogenate dehydrogenase [Vacuolonema iberomarrocanum]|uniref:prephenate/arogenate dehydrogenase n=1 Tax=Vacuolonema iberomarrocanum TaxID=3454632 RepID=UPI0019F0ED1A|nr:prephenate/arogenate dehydrogenase [filamentous cyanobacterium LEGE 07170]